MAVPADLMAALQGGGGAPAPAPAGPPQQGSLPGDLVSALQAAGPPPEPPTQAGRPGITDGAPGGGADPLTDAINLIQEAIDSESDQEDIQTMLQCQAKLQSILAKNQAEADSALQGKTTPKAARKMAGGAGGGSY